ncbi:MAG: cell division protein ZapD [Gammaproteobacteria bacterium]|nr:cell division protein ZapD [Gammaproteobacteria bacterium]
MSDVVIYEQPLNELTRVCLRLEHLLGQADHEMKDDSIEGTRNILTTLISILQLLERPDLKAKLAKEIGQQIRSLSRHEQSPVVDQTKLNELLAKLNALSEEFINSSGKIGQSLREVELLNSLRLHLSTPGGGCNFDMPLYHYWLKQPAHIRQSMIRSWFAEFDSVRLANTLILRLIREESRQHAKTAVNGFHQELLDAQNNLRLIRVAVPKTSEAYPEISLNRHFLSIRFLIPTILGRPTQVQSNLSFWLSYCSV